MRNRTAIRLDTRRWLGAALASLLTLGSLVAVAQDSAVPRAQILRERFDSLEGIKHEPMELMVKARRQCASGQDPQAVAKSRALGADTAADASDHCPAVLARVATEGGLLELYEELLKSLGGSPDLSGTLPAAIGAAVMQRVDQVPIGNERAAVVSDALAFDAGFTVAYRKRQAMTPGMPGLSSIKPIAERCLALSEGDLGLCYSTGYVYGSRALSGQPLAELP